MRGATGAFSTPAAPPPGARPAAAGPGEYTRIFGTAAPYAKTDVAPQAGAVPPPPVQPGVAPAPIAAPAAPAAPAPKAARSMMLPIILVGVMVLAMLGVMIYFAMKK